MQEKRDGRTLLLVEDNKEIRTIFSDVFQGEGYQVLEAGNGAEAYAILEQENNLVNVVLTDLRMPSMDGMEFAKKLDSDIRFSRIPIVLLSATPMPNSSHALRFFDALLIKPCPINLLISTVNAVQKFSLQ
ncbi:response regulator [Herbaspirillum sp. NPDC087042]|uniref:response regulator n=1 Tax=Herbaspirillum sp. NPDC087042 TaxID=3364004 RepID=UPI00381BAB3E